VHGHGEISLQDGANLSIWGLCNGATALARSLSFFLFMYNRIMHEQSLRDKAEGHLR
jgi:hypothetical protein